MQGVFAGDFEAQEIARPGCRGCCGTEEQSLAAAEFDFQGGGTAEQSGTIERLRQILDGQKRAREIESLTDFSQRPPSHSANS